MNQCGLPILDIASTASSSSLYTNLNEPSCSTSCDGDEESDEIIQVNAKTKTEKFNYMLTSFVHRFRDKYYFNCPEKAHFYTSLPSYEVFMIVFEHVAPHLSRRPGSTILNRFQ